MKFCRYRDPGKTPYPGSYRDCPRDPGQILGVLGLLEKLQLPVSEHMFLPLTAGHTPVVVTGARCALFWWWKPTFDPPTIDPPTIDQRELTLGSIMSHLNLNLATTDPQKIDPSNFFSSKIEIEITFPKMCFELSETNNKPTYSFFYSKKC